MKNTGGHFQDPPGFLYRNDVTRLPGDSQFTGGGMFWRQFKFRGQTYFVKAVQSSGVNSVGFSERVHKQLYDVR